MVRILRAGEKFRVSRNPIDPDSSPSFVSGMNKYRGRIVIHLAPASEPVLLKERKYSYVALNPDKGRKVNVVVKGNCEVKGIITAKNTSEAINKLRNMGYFPIKVIEREGKA